MMQRMFCIVKAVKLFLDIIIVNIILLLSGPLGSSVGFIVIISKKILFESVLY